MGNDLRGVRWNAIQISNYMKSITIDIKVRMWQCVVLIT